MILNYFSPTCHLTLGYYPVNIMASSAKNKFADKTHFKLYLNKDFPPVSVKETSIDWPVTIEPSKSAKINSGFYIHQKGDHLINLELTQYYSTTLLLPDKSSQKVIGPQFKVIKYSECPITIPSHKKIFRATFIPLDDVHIYQEVLVGKEVVDMEDRENDLYSLNLMQIKEMRETREREMAAQKAGEVIANAVKQMTDSQKSSVVD